MCFVGQLGKSERLKPSERRLAISQEDDRRETVSPVTVTAAVGFGNAKTCRWQNLSRVFGDSGRIF